MFLGYNTNGLAHHSLAQAIGLLADLGYRGVAITIDHHALRPAAESSGHTLCAVRPVGGNSVADRVGSGVASYNVTPSVPATERLAEAKAMLRTAGLRSVIETGARYLLDARQKHEPTLMTADADGRVRRMAFYRHAIRCAAELESDCVSLWSGVLRDNVPRAAAMQRLVGGLGEVLDDAAREGVLVAFEPEPGMFIDTLAAYGELRRHIDHPNLRLTIDVGHLHCQGETPIADYIRRWAPTSSSTSTSKTCAPASTST